MKEMLLQIGMISNSICNNNENYSHLSLLNMLRPRYPMPKVYIIISQAALHKVLESGQLAYNHVL